MLAVIAVKFGARGSQEGSCCLYETLRTHLAVTEVTAKKPTTGTPGGRQEGYCCRCAPLRPHPAGTEVAAKKPTSGTGVVV